MDEKEKWLYAAETQDQAEKRLAENPPRQTEGLFHCPCCGFPTLDERTIFDICLICWWEDDGQDDHNSCLVLWGPNQGYSLDAARENFGNHKHMYDLGKEIDYLKESDRWRDDLMRIVRPAMEGESPFDIRAFKLWLSAYNKSQEVN
ncbi:MAG: hypothetical protein COB08_003750 [Rhodobacteraceae bacterium]|nr:hypothetical protein [Paracoccaceae bacterium]